jgi:hypothetical protein
VGLICFKNTPRDRRKKARFFFLLFCKKICRYGPFAKTLLLKLLKWSTVSSPGHSSILDTWDGSSSAKVPHSHQRFPTSSWGHTLELPFSPLSHQLSRAYFLLWDAGSTGSATYRTVCVLGETAPNRTHHPFLGKLLFLLIPLLFNQTPEQEAREPSSSALSLTYYIQLVPKSNHSTCSFSPHMPLKLLSSSNCICSYLVSNSGLNPISDPIQSTRANLFNFRRTNLIRFLKLFS